MNELSKLDMNNQTVSTHRDYRDISFYEDNSKIEKVNLLAEIPVAIKSEYGTNQAEVLETKKLIVILVCTILQLISCYQLDQLVQHTS